MKQRLITVAIAAPLIVIHLYLFQTIALNILIAAICVVAVHEMMTAIKLTENKALMAVCLIYAGISPFLMIPSLRFLQKAALFVFLLALFLMMLIKKGALAFEKVAVSAFVSALIPCAMNFAIAMRDDFPMDGLFFYAIAMMGAWVTDGGGYFVGTFFGKTKLAPTISPKKTVEGFVGGILANLIITTLVGSIYGLCCAWGNPLVVIHYWQFPLFAVLSSVISVLGDLVASLIKRQCAVKDYGKLIPGHGGVMDRFDSVLFTIPFTYIFIAYFPMIERLLK